MAVGSQKILGQSRPESAENGAKLLSVDELNDLVDATLKNMRRHVLGDEVKIAEHG